MLAAEGESLGDLLDMDEKEEERGKGESERGSIGDASLDIYRYGESTWMYGRGVWSLDNFSFPSFHL